MRSLKVVICLLAISILSSCARGNSSADFGKIRNYLSGLSEFSYTAEIVINSGAYVDIYTLNVSEKDGECSINVIEPEVLAPLGVVISGDDLKMSYSDAVFDSKIPNSLLPSPLLLIPESFKAIREGSLLSCEKNGSRLCAEFSRFTGDEEYVYLYLFDSESFFPESAEVFLKGERIAVITYLSFDSIK